MDSKTAIIIFNIPHRGLTADLEVPLDISANDLFVVVVEHVNGNAAHTTLPSRNERNASAASDFKAN